MGSRVQAEEQANNKRRGAHVLREGGGREDGSLSIRIDDLGLLNREEALKVMN